MYVELIFSYKGKIYSWDLSENLMLRRIEIPNVFIIDLFHTKSSGSFGYKAFFYDSKRIISYRYVKGKRNLIRELRKLLKENLGE